MSEENFPEGRIQQLLNSSFAPDWVKLEFMDYIQCFKQLQADSEREIEALRKEVEGNQEVLEYQKQWIARLQAELESARRSAWDAALKSVDFMCDGVGKLNQTFDDWKALEGK